MGRFHPFAKPSANGRSLRTADFRPPAADIKERLRVPDPEASTLRLPRGCAGDMAVLRLCMERIIPPRKDRAVRLALPRVASSQDAR
jgi:hypothetical protein